MYRAAELTHKAQTSSGTSATDDGPSNDAAAVFAAGAPVDDAKDTHESSTESSSKGSTVPSLPPPPVQLSTSHASSAKTMTTPLPPPPPPAPYSSRTPLFSSAPPSGNLSRADMQTLQQSANSGGSSSFGTTTLPPPPPPPPPRKTGAKPTGGTLEASLNSLPGQTTAPGEDEVTVVASNKSPKVGNSGDDTFTSGTLGSTVSSAPAMPTIAPIPAARPPPPTMETLTRPAPLPLTAFAKLPKTAAASSNSNVANAKGATAVAGPSILASRQGELVVLVVATEKAHLVAWKNNLLLQDLLQGLMHTVSSTAATSSSSAAAAAAAAPALPPFRSVNRPLNLQWSDIQVKFVVTSDPTTGGATHPTTGSNTADDNARAQEILQEAAALQDTDGNLAQELQILEDQVDQLIQDDDNENESVDRASGDGPVDLDDPEARTLSGEKRNRIPLSQVAAQAFKLTSPLTLPWMRRYRHALDVVTANQPHDLTACPGLVLLVCTTQEQQSTSESPGSDVLTNRSQAIIETLRALESEHYLPPEYAAGLWDAQQLRREVLVLHDQIHGPSAWDESALRQELQLTYGPAAAIVRLNSITPEIAQQLALEETSDLWQGGGKRGNCMSVSDRVVLRNYLAQLVTTSLLPSIERRISHLNGIVSERKKGVRNVFKNLWRTSSAPTSGNNPAGESSNSGASTSITNSSGLEKKVVVRYRHDTIESQTRLLADTLFVMRDYEAALSTYRLIKDDYKQDRALPHYGSCQEMMALCMLLLDPYGRSRDIFSNLENALLSYTKAAAEESMATGTGAGGGSNRPPLSPPSTRSATRLCLVLLSSRNLSMGRPLEVADLLASASSNETALGAAVLLEQASAHYYKAGLFRKYSFHMLMSGHMFRTASQENHAFRCFASALYLYRHAHWKELHHHLQSALAAQLYSMNRLSLALQLYAKLLSIRGAVSVKSQQKFLNHLLEICNEHPKKALAGSDRMMPAGERQGRLDRIVQVIRYTKTAHRVLEIPNMQLPRIDDHTVNVMVVEQTGEDLPENATSLSLGTPDRGDSDVWHQLMLETTAEWNAMSQQSGQLDAGVVGNPVDEAQTAALQKIADTDLRQVVAEMEREKGRRALAERTKRSATYRPTPAVRALEEPLTVEFVAHNPLGIPLDLNDIQLVARMTQPPSADSSIAGQMPTVCTNEDAIEITPLTRTEPKIWKFPSSSSLEFHLPQFCRVSTGGGNERQKWKSAAETSPLFVVTKTSLTLPAESSSKIRASLCPLAQGQLEILGVRCRLLDSVWVYHSFQVLGELLQNTRENRARRVRGESLLLKATVEQAMPCLTAQLWQPHIRAAGSGNGPLLQGQISKWNLRLSNVGTAPAKAVSLKTNLPWITIWAGADMTTMSCEEREREAVSYSVGPSGTLLRIPLAGEQLGPGETMDVAVDVRTIGSGRQDFYMLFRYELVENITGETAVSLSSIKHRWLQKMYSVPIYPSLSLSATLMPSYSQQSEHMLSLDITNYRSDRPEKLDLLVKEIHLASRSYKLELIPGQLDPSDEERPALTLGWQERATLHYRVLPLEDFSPICLLSESNLLTQRTTSKPACVSTILHILCLDRAHRQFQETWASHQRAMARAARVQDSQDAPRSIAQIRRANTSAMADDTKTDTALDTISPTSIRKLTPPENSAHQGILVCTWKNQDDTIEGQHHIRALLVRPRKQTNGCPIVVTGSHPAMVSNDFAAGPAQVPLEVFLRNRLLSGTVSFEFAVETDNEFDITGPESFKWSLKGGEELQIPLKAILPSAGVYNLQKVRLTIEGDEPVSYMFPLQWNVVAQNKD